MVFLRRRMMHKRLLVLLLFICISPFQAVNAESSLEKPMFTMVIVPEGKFQRDSNPENISVISHYKMSTTEVTRNQFAAIMGTDPSRKDSSTGEDDPVTMVNWYQIIAFCNKLSIKEGKKPVYSVESIVDWREIEYRNIPIAGNAKWNAVKCDWSANGYRLPTEMEWLWAAMGAPADGQNGGINTTGYMKKFSGDSGSNKIQEYANVQSNNEIGILSTRPVAMRKPNEIGIYDMSGNVWEWCWDWFANSGGPHRNDGKGQEYKIKGIVIDYRGGMGSDYGLKVIRGGSLDGEDARCYLSYRMICGTTNATDSCGFRIACAK